MLIFHALQKKPVGRTRRLVHLCWNGWVQDVWCILPFLMSLFFDEGIFFILILSHPTLFLASPLYVRTRAYSVRMGCAFDGIFMSTLCLIIACFVSRGSGSAPEHSFFAVTVIIIIMPSFCPSPVIFNRRGTIYLFTYEVYGFRLKLN